MKALHLFESRPDHPLADPLELARVLSALAQAKPAEALQELQHWLGTLRDFDGFDCAERLALVKRLDAAARPVAGKVFAEFLGLAHRRDRAERARGELLRAYFDHLSGAYGRCVADDELHGKRGELGEELPLALARSYRAALAGAKVRCMVYLPVPDDYCDAGYRLLRFAEVAHFDSASLRVYEREVRSTPRVELVKLLAFQVCEPHDLPPEQVELAARILDRFAPSFAWSATPTPQCAAFVDLAAGGLPRRLDGKPAVASARYFGAGSALAKLAEIEGLSARNLLSEEMRFGHEFSLTQVVTVIRHLLRCLGPVPPRRAAAREPRAGALEVLHGFRAICSSVTTLDVGANAALQDDLKLAAKKKQSGLEVETEAVKLHPEAWKIVDRSAWGIGAAIPAGSGAWVEPGVLCALREAAAAPWAVGIVRRLDATPSGESRCGLQILSRKPLSVWLRVLGREGFEVSNWETSTGSFAYDYARAIVLPDAAKADGKPVLLLAAGKFVPDQICEIVMGEHSRHIRLAEFLEEGADYLRAAFVWMAPGKS
jgi:hypothetical protein